MAAQGDVCWRKASLGSRRTAKQQILLYARSTEKLQQSIEHGRSFLLRSRPQILISEKQPLAAAGHSTDHKWLQHEHTWLPEQVTVAAGDRADKMLTICQALARKTAAIFHGPDLGCRTRVLSSDILLIVSSRDQARYLQIRQGIARTNEISIKARYPKKR